MRQVSLAGRQMQRIEQPVQVIWGLRDTALGPPLAEPPARWVPDCRVVKAPKASHWVQNDAPEMVNTLLMDFLKGRQ